jgi:hypothetical protein
MAWLMSGMALGMMYLCYLLLLERNKICHRLRLVNYVVEVLLFVSVPREELTNCSRPLAT